MKSSDTPCYQNILRDELSSRQQKNPHYSLRAFARDLDLAPSQLSDVMRGRYGISKKVAAQISNKMNWNELEKALFIDLVESKHSRSQKQREAACTRLVAAKQEYSQLSAKKFVDISDWHYNALLELVETDGFKNDLKWIAKSLNLQVPVVTAAIKKLQQLKLLKISKNKMSVTTDFSSTSSEVSSASIQKYHTQYLHKAEQALQFQSLDERDFSSLVLAFDPSQMQEAKADIQNFRRTFNKKYSMGTQKKWVYCLAMQFFRVQEKGE